MATSSCSLCPHPQNNNQTNDDDDNDNNDNDDKNTPIQEHVVLEDREMTAGRQGWGDRHTTIILLER